MELVYLWVEKYKNIENQGVNFSPRFTCKYENGELTIEPKEHHSIFPPNINVTAIVGENGSGKSNILACLAEIFRIEYNKNRNLIVDYDHTFEFCLTFILKNKIYEIKSIKNSDTNSFKDTEKIENILDYFIYSNDKSNIKNQILLDDVSIARMLIYDYSKKRRNEKTSFKLSSFMYLPSQIIIKQCDFEKFFYKLISNDKLYPMYHNEPDFIYIKNTTDEINKHTKKFESIIDKYHQFLILNLLKKSSEKYYSYLSKEDIIKILQDKDLLSEKDFYQYFNFSQDYQNEEKKQIEQLTSEEKKIYISKYSDFFEFDFVDDKQRRYSNLSHGEKTFFGQLLNVYYNSEISKNNDFLFFFDEPEISLHPNWQKSYIKELYTLLEQIGKNYHFIFASHSPFLLSDIPKENIIFLEKGKDGNCKNITNEANIETFGANIHTLLSHGFFMDGGLMGEFAKEKINKAIEFLNKKQLTPEELDYCENIISIIGEPIVKRQLQRMLDSKKLDKMKEIDALKNQIESLQSRLETLEKKS